VPLDGAEPGGAFALATLTLPPHSADAPLSAHTGHAIGYYVLSGTLAATVAERTVVVRAGAAVYVAPNAPHACWNPAAAPAVLLLITAPACSAHVARDRAPS
jgi:mannose-6-phosphate isomerase-like protein (cupin superfamily)